MALATTLLHLTDPEAQTDLAHGLIRHGYEVVTANNFNEAVLFLQNMPFSVVLLPAGQWLDLPPEPLRRLMEEPRDDDPTLVVLGTRPTEEEDLRRDVIYLPVWNLDQDALLERLRVVLLGGFLDLPPDAAGTSLVGSIAQSPFLELVPALAQSGERCRLEIDGAGSCWFRGGEVVGARSGTHHGTARGAKAFFRLARGLEGALRVGLGDPPTDEPDIALGLDLPVDALVQDAVMDSLGDRPDLLARAALKMGPEMFAGSFDVHEQKLLTAAKDGATVGELLDALPEPDSVVVDRLYGLVDRGVLTLSPPSRRVAIATDSTSDLPMQVARDLGVDVVPLSVHFGDRAFLDRTELTPRGFYELLANSPDHPSSQPPPPALFLDHFRQHVETSDVVSIHISGELSKTVEHARSAAERLANESGESSSGHAVEVIDARQVSLGLGLVAKFAARMAARELSLQEITHRVQDLAGRVHVLFAVNTLDYLERGGRIGKMQAFVGSLLRVKPILGIDDGKIVAVDKVRGGRQVQPRLLELALERIDQDAPVAGYIAHANAPQWADRLRELLSEHLTLTELDVIEIGPVVGTHTGPGTVGMALCALRDEEVELLGA